ncbi:3-hydroxyacyl-ACP dehydratase FabZ [Butyrivibrio sp. YAB3001]|uniref:3-hydroxyacyl-ACP dehydratase FabZ n=1 Tax=Butyrivibrio sp. YAB3001 TaxID=1520812 RepID=UPI0008F65037|nr:3-hydroxyacyl-ACP dehydratase FabZ [Butyrivibrio sp. YAB3001]SFC12626.1 3-hydroxyacyl-[acyl-carrier-protein] dehydratase [Butyrivibrio sp. YAB3001]
MQITIDEIMSVLEHRYPFLMIDKITDFEYGKFVEAVKNVSVNEPWSQGHFPGKPIYPGAMIIESAAQAGGFIFYNKDDEEKKRGGMLVKVGNFKFVKVVRPGDQLVIRTELVDQIGNYVTVRVKATVDGKKVAEGEETYVVGC